MSIEAVLTQKAEAKQEAKKQKAIYQEAKHKHSIAASKALFTEADKELIAEQVNTLKSFGTTPLMSWGDLSKHGNILKYLKLFDIDKDVKLFATSILCDDDLKKAITEYDTAKEIYCKALRELMLSKATLLNALIQNKLFGFLRVSTKKLAKAAADMRKHSERYNTQY
ncbi:hypothetical protein FDJ19_gp097 [Vibrio phage Ceto]|uniref:Uncharacterized protein n=1 Tax=Vibrio phage Ceto TaxID=2570300 RepID=A0A2H5BGS6_9CAUD|nr:hypothetical protein FDJ19_gp016 [Vibrio phage Ceto]YP_009621282.1 hypothetical protein FDJ19_gp097 [Vibrio phage Ceto]AUG85023.1 hypothetical protein CETO_16 [Vibrio phage Ceto]AUG85201.1 hypothetical protein CETO_219 [Vibrio phage Ceto]